MFRQLRKNFSIVALLACGVAATIGSNARAEQPAKVLAKHAPAAPFASFKTVTLFRGVISMGKAFDFDVWLKWDTTKGKLQATGKIQCMGTNLVVSDTNCKMVNGNTLEVTKKVEGKSGLRVHTVIHFMPQKDGTIKWDATYHGENKHTSKGKVSGKKSGVIKPKVAPWKAGSGIKKPNWIPPVPFKF